MNKNRFPSSKPRTRSSPKPFSPNNPTKPHVTHYDCEDNQQKTLHKNEINQETQCEFELQDIESTTELTTLNSKTRAL